MDSIFTYIHYLYKMWFMFPRDQEEVSLINRR